MEIIIEGGSKNIRRSYMEYPIVSINSLPISRTNKGRIYSRLSITDGDSRPKYIASKHLYSKYYTLIYIWRARLISALYTTIL